MIMATMLSTVALDLGNAGAPVLRREAFHLWGQSKRGSSIFSLKATLCNSCPIVCSSSAVVQMLFWGANFGEGDATKHFRVTKGFPVEGGRHSVNKGLVRISTVKAVQWRGPGHSVNHTQDSENWKVAVLIPFPKISAFLFGKWWQL